MRSFWSFAGCVAFAMSTLADEPIRILCDPQDPAKNCPGPNCLCAPDRLEVDFRGPGGSTYTYPEFHPGMGVELSIVVVAESPTIEGFSLGLAHDPADLEAVRADVDLDLAQYFVCELCPGNWPIHDVETCGDDPECKPENRKPGGGVVAAAILGLTQPVHLPLGRSRAFYAGYKLLRDVGEDGTRLRFTDRLAYRGSPHTNLNVTMDGRSHIWGYARDGLIRRALPDVGRFRRGDADGDGRVSVTDALWIILGAVDRLGRDFPCEKALDADDDGRANLADAVFLLRHLFAQGPPLPAPAPDCGADATVDDLPCSDLDCP